ncbi:MAG: VOC family protein, partial [Nonomuraea sp.]|nr:VOC family protein [Nonomuraea sp.]
PAGATFAVWQPQPPGPAAAWAEPGAVSWAEVNAPDGKAADAFYGALFGYEQRQVPGGIDYVTYLAGGEPVCGRLRMDEHWAGVPPHWMVYFDVTSMESAVRIVEEQGGQVAVRPFDSPFGRISVVSHPAAGFFSLRQPSG